MFNPLLYLLDYLLFFYVSVIYFQIALIGHCLAVTDPIQSAANQSDGSRKPVLVYASTNGERKTLKEEKKRDSVEASLLALLKDSRQVDSMRALEQNV